MFPRQSAAILFALAVWLTGCQSAGVSPTPTAAPSEAEPGTSGEPSPPDAGSTIDPDWVKRPALTCGDNRRLFPPEALTGIGLGELGLDPAAGVLRSVIAEAPAETPFPESGWHRVIDNPDGVTFVVTGDESTPWWTVTVGLVNGSLQATEYGECKLAVAPPSGVNFARWWLDPNGPPITPETTTIAILIRERACASGKPPEGRVLEPTVITTTDAVQLAIAIREQSTAQDCQGNPAHAIEVVLPEPLGSRGLFDASQFPAFPVTTEDPG